MLHIWALPGTATCGRFRACCRSQATVTASRKDAFVAKSRIQPIVAVPRKSPKGSKSKGRSKVMAYKYIDLFAGIGGMHQAMENLKVGAECVFASEWDAYAQRTYLANFPLTPIFGDITRIAPAEIPDHDLLIAGFPCQPFSIAGVSKKNSLGRAHGFNDPTQGTLFFNIRAIIAAKRPRAFVLENVKNLKSHDGGNTYRIILDVLRNDLGYHVPEPQILDGRAFVPQHRERIFIVGFRDEHDFKFPGLGKAPHTLEEILDLNSRVEPRYTLSDKLWDYLQRYAAKHRAAGNGFGFGKVGRGGVARTLSARYYKDGSEILIDQGRKNPRRLTPRECARLMGFPERFQIPVSDTRAYKQFGNSVVVPLVEAVCREVVVALDRQDSRGKLARSASSLRAVGSSS